MRVIGVVKLSHLGHPKGIHSTFYSNLHWFFSFQVYSKNKVKEDKNFKTLRQNNAVLRWAALSSSKVVPDRAH
jgi:hypothetical protein